MKGKIDLGGYLVIYRGGVMFECSCVNGGLCNHSCVAFREPVKQTNGYPGTIETGRTTLQLCSQVGTLIFDEFEDERAE